MGQLYETLEGRARGLSPLDIRTMYIVNNINVNKSRLRFDMWKSYLCAKAGHAAILVHTLAQRSIVVNYIHVYLILCRMNVPSIALPLCSGHCYCPSTRIDHFIKVHVHDEAHVFQGQIHCRDTQRLKLRLNPVQCMY